MNLKRPKVLRLGLWALIAVALGLLAVWNTSAPSTQAQPTNSMAVDSDASDATVDASALVPLGGQVTIDVVITDATAGYAGFQAMVRYDSAVLTWVPIDTTAPPYNCPTPPGNKKVVYFTGSGACDTLHGTATDSAVSGSIREVATGSPTVPSPLASPLVEMKFECDATTPGTSALHLRDSTDVPASYSTTLDGAANVIPTNLADGEIVCNYVADWSGTKVDNEPVIAGGSVTYTTTFTNNGPNASPAPIFADMLALEKTVQGTPGIPDPPSGTQTTPVIDPTGVTFTTTPSGWTGDCEWYETFDATTLGFGIRHNVVLCDLYGYIGAGGASFPLPNGAVVVLEVVADIPLSDAGKTNANVVLSGDLVATDDDPSDEAECATLEGLGVIPDTPENSLACEFTDVEEADVTLAKAGAPTDGNTEGDQITWTLTLTCGQAGSYCSDAATATTGPVVTDNVEDDTAGLWPPFEGSGEQDQSINSAAFTQGTGTCVVNHADASGNDKVTDPDVTCTVTSPMAPGDVAVIEIVTDIDSVTAPTRCENRAYVSWADGPTGALGMNADADVGCVPPTVNQALDKGSGVIPDPIAVLVGQTARVTVWEQLEIVDPGLNPNVNHTWIVGDGGPAVVFDWVQEAGDSAGDINDNLYGVGTFDPYAEEIQFQTTGHTTGLVVISRQLDVKCTAATGVRTANVSIVSSPAAPSPTSFEVKCYDQPEELKVPDDADIWIMRHPNCVDDDGDGLVDEDPVDQVDNDGDTLVDEDFGPCNPYEGKGSVLIEEKAYAIADADSPNDADSDPEGLGAYEKQIKFDHKLISLQVEDASYLGSTGRTVYCDLTVITENWILFGCVSTGSQNGPTSPGPVTLTKIWVTPAEDLVDRMRPTKDNGVVTTLLDENCEWADKFGDPMLGMVGGGMVPVCGDATITIHMLEGDLNLDCNVDVLDEQAIAFRYGASFGLLLYSQWYDLEPKFADFDIDIKDLQFVFGRDGSSCQDPIPLQ